MANVGIYKYRFRQILISFGSIIKHLQNPWITALQLLYQVKERLYYYNRQLRYFKAGLVFEQNTIICQLLI
ncbi:MAG: hypothetical protein JWR54_1659 [Mucilaginibacter sp.]|nr:hypothetical protein [Mucilaginibacter sp.]